MALELEAITTTYQQKISIHITIHLVKKRQRTMDEEYFLMKTEIRDWNFQSIGTMGQLKQMVCLTTYQQKISVHITIHLVLFMKWMQLYRRGSFQRMQLYRRGSLQGVLPQSRP